MSYNPFASAMTTYIGGGPTPTPGPNPNPPTPVSFTATTLNGPQDGQNAAFTLGMRPNSGVLVVKNGMVQHYGPTQDFVWDGNVTITFDAGNIPQSDDALLAFVW